MSAPLTIGFSQGKPNYVLATGLTAIPQDFIKQLLHTVGTY